MPAVGSMRFRQPAERSPWSGVFEAFSTAPAPQQAKTVGVGLRGATHVDEDCLYLNVYAPAQVAQPLPVFVWIYGGGFIHGDGSDPLFDGSNLAAAGAMVVVTINYRLGVWGFVPFARAQRRSSRPDRRVRMGEAQHRGFRRRPRQRDDCRRIGGRHERLQPAGRSVCARSVSPCDRAERRRRQRCDARSGRRNGRRRCARNSGSDPDDADVASLLRAQHAVMQSSAAGASRKPDTAARRRRRAAGRIR